MSNLIPFLLSPILNLTIATSALRWKGSSPLSSFFVVFVVRLVRFFLFGFLSHIQSFILCHHSVVLVLRFVEHFREANITSGLLATFYYLILVFRRTLCR